MEASRSNTLVPPKKSIGQMLDNSSMHGLQRPVVESKHMVESDALDNAKAALALVRIFEGIDLDRLRATLQAVSRQHWH